MAYRFEVFKDKSDKFRFNFKAPNGQIMFSSQSYSSKSSAMKTIASLQDNVSGAEVVEVEND